MTRRVPRLELIDRRQRLLLKWRRIAKARKQGAHVGEESYPASLHDHASDRDELRALEEALEVAPGGALIVSGIAVGLLILCWLIIYAFVFLPRGPVG